MKVLLCDPDLIWGERMKFCLQECGFDVKVMKELEELWDLSEDVRGIIVSLQELNSMLFWGTTIPGTQECSRDYPLVIRSLCLQNKKVIIVLPELSYDIECTCLKAGAAECIHKGQPMDLMKQRIVRILEEERKKNILWFAGIRFDRTEGKLSFREQSVSFTTMEQKIVEALMEQGTDLTGKRTLLLQLWGEHGQMQQHRLDTLMKQIRQKLQGFPMHIHTVYGRGYRLETVHSKDR